MKVYEVVSYYSEFEPPMSHKLFQTKSSAYKYILKQRYEQWWMWQHHRTCYEKCLFSSMPELYDVNKFEIIEKEIVE